MTDQEPEDEGAEIFGSDEPTAADLFQEAYNNLVMGIDGFMQFIGEVTPDRILTNWVMVATSAGVDEDGEFYESDPLVFPRRAQAGWLTKGLLRDAIDSNNLSDVAAVMIHISKGAEDDDEG